ncbi:MAG: putative Ig domain-containing protein, partial [Acidobacteriota bacterium]
MPSYKKASARLLALCVVFCFAAVARASTFTIPTDDDLIVGARAIVRGKVLSVTCQLDDQTGRIFTYVRLSVREVLKGQVSDREIVIKEEGGQTGNRGSIIFGTPGFENGEKVLLYLDTWRDGSLRVYQMFLGKFSIIDDLATGEQIALRTAPDKNTSVLQSKTLTAVHAATSRMELSAYRKMVRRRLRANRERSQNFDETYYRSTPMLVEPAEYRGGSGGELEPQFTFLTTPPPRWFEPDVGQPVVFMVNPDGAPNPQILNDISAAMNAWSSVPGCSLRVVNGGSSAVCYSQTSNNIVFNNCDGRFPASPICASILALGGVSWDPSQTKVINGTTFVRAAAGFISFNPYASCIFGDPCVVREIATHELGHSLGLGHSQFADATMFGVAHLDGRCASIHQDDIDAITFVYPASGGGPGPLTILSTSPLGIATVGSAFSRQLLASGGATPYSWSLVSGLLPDGLNVLPTGIISGTPTSIGTSDFTVRVTDTQNASAQKALSITVIAPATGLDSQFISQDVPTNLNPGQSFFATIRWINTGSKEWNGAAGFSVISQNPTNNATWGGNNVPWFGLPLAPGEQMELLFQAFAPSRAGTYDFQWQLYQQGSGSFGQMSANV